MKTVTGTDIEIDVLKNYKADFKKFSGDTDQEVIEAVAGKTEEGYNLHITDADLTKENQLLASGNSTQEVIEAVAGTTVSGLGSISVNDVDTTKEHLIIGEGNTEQFTTTGKNLFNIIDYTTLQLNTNGSATSTKSTNNFVINLGSSSSSIGVYISNAKIKTYIDNYSDITYYLSLDIKASRSMTMQIGGDNRPSNIAVGTTTSRHVIQTAFVNNGLIFYTKSGNENGDTIEISNIMISTNSNTDFEPYTGRTSKS